MSYSGRATYSSDNSNVALINTNTGEVTLKSIGTAEISASRNGNENYNLATDKYQINVS